jgi:hypothetical protein
VNDLSTLDSGDNDNSGVEAEDEDEGFGDDFDDFEEGQEAEDADFGEFDDGFQDGGVKSPAFESSPALPVTPQPTIVSIRNISFRHDIESTHDQRTRCHCIDRNH